MFLFVQSPSGRVQTARQTYLADLHDQDSKLAALLEQDKYSAYLSAQLKQAVEPQLSRLLKNKFEYNSHLRVKLSTHTVISEQIPPRQQESRLVLNYFPAQCLQSLKVVFNKPDSEISEENLLRLMTVYILCEKRIVIYSVNKELLLELIKPLQFVNPIIQGVARDSFLDYLDAPMSIILGVWGERKNTQKIDISLKKSPTLKKRASVVDQIEKQTLQIRDGIIVNVDSSKVFGQLDDQLNSIAECLSQHLGTYKSSADELQQFNQLLNLVYNNQLPHLQWAVALKKRIKATQAYTYFTQAS